VFYKDSQNIYRARPLEKFDWLVHGFGTRWSDSFGSCGNLATLRQIHSATVVHGGGRCGSLGEGDALIENTAGVLVAVKTADCVPILLVDSRLRIVAAVHAGWRGTAQKIAANTIAEMQTKFGSRVQDLHVAIGPGISKCCYEVGPEVAAQFQDRGVKSNGPVHLDLPAINSKLIEELGVPAGQIYRADICTMCNEEFYSYRRDKQKAGRMLSVIGTR
jgi:hypothetical protein